MTDNAPTLDPARDTAVPDGETVVAQCPYCERPFRREHARDLHVGKRHHPADEERERYDAAIEQERDDLWLFHAKAVIALGVIYAATVIIYMAVLGSFF